MSKRRPKKVAKKTDVAARLRKALAKRTKAELIDVLVEWAGENRNLLRRLAEQLVHRRAQHPRALPVENLGLPDVGT